MSENTELTQVADNLVVTMDYTLTVENQIIDSSKENGPIRFVQGSGEIIPGLERRLNGLALGENQSFTVSANEGYGEFNEVRIFRNYSRSWRNNRRINMWTMYGRTYGSSRFR